MNDFFKGERYVPKPQAGTLAVMRRFGPFNHPLSNRQNCNHLTFWSCQLLYLRAKKGFRQKKSSTHYAQGDWAALARRRQQRRFSHEIFMLFFCVFREKRNFLAVCNTAATVVVHTPTRDVSTIHSLGFLWKLQQLILKQKDCQSPPPRAPPANVNTLVAKGFS